MHDGRFATMEEVIEYYSTGVHRRATLDPNLAKHPETGQHLTDPDKAALVAFLKTLSDEKSPWQCVPTVLVGSIPPAETAGTGYSYGK